ncbi:MAG: LysR family transcriptional regulator [Gloeocapsa sp. UFS-A4-WI-NPMV-4B04]|jgi:DNA-binding transcriptional LysR family regulator|nr:LysR family transcriptional regulator [Gloeocapsa sp. UFS-A4-WI-NPMV-4B04]
MELRHLHYFIAVAEELHFSRAAERLHISQPPLSQQIRDLEDELGVKLFERTKRQVHLTEAGKVFLERSYGVLAQLEHAIAVTQQIGRGEVGRLAIGFVDSATYTLLPEILRVFREQFPAVELRLHELTTTQQIQALYDKQVDVGIVRSAISEPGLSVECLLPELLVLALPETHPLSAQTQVSLSTLAAELFILFPAQMGPVFYEQLPFVNKPDFVRKSLKRQFRCKLSSAWLQQDWALRSFPPPCKTSTEAESFTDHYKNRSLKPDFIWLGGSIIPPQS